VDENGVAAVDLTRQARAADPQQRVVLEQQLKATLGLSGGSSTNGTITDLVLSVERSRFDVPSGPVRAASTASGQQPVELTARLSVSRTVSAQPVVLDGRGRIARLVDGRLTEVGGLDSLAVAGTTNPAVAPDATAYAVLGEGRTRLLVAPRGGPASVVTRGAELVAPSFDPQGWVWTGPAASTGAVSAGRLSAGTVSVAAPWLRGLRLLSLRLSRDGARAVVLAQNPTTSVLYVCGVVRDPRSGQPQRLAAPMAMVPDLQRASDAAWVDDRRVVVLGRRVGQPDQPWIAEVGGVVEGTVALTPQQKAVRVVTAGNDASELYLGGDDGRVWRRTGGQWTLMAVPAARWPAMPG
jgi:hypothetical protein